MHTNDLIRFLSDHKGVLECAKDGAGATVITIKVYFADGVERSAVGGEVDPLVSSLMRAYKRFVKYRDVVPLTPHKQK